MEPSSAHARDFTGAASGEALQKRLTYCWLVVTIATTVLAFLTLAILVSLFVNTMITKLTETA